MPPRRNLFEDPGPWLNEASDGLLGCPLSFGEGREKARDLFVADRAVRAMGRFWPDVLGGVHRLGQRYGLRAAVRRRERCLRAGLSGIGPTSAERMSTSDNVAKALVYVDAYISRNGRRVTR